MLKRGLDILVSGALLIALSPLFALIAALIRLTSPGPVLYRQVRLGLEGRPFHLLKFRTMVSGAERGTGPVWACRNDPRCTTLGRILRRTSLDELPQLWQAFTGRMSLIGPRPERPVFVKRFRRTLPQYPLRHRVHVGITGWAQVHGWRGNTSIRRRLECDLYYVRNWSLLLDLKILWLTLRRGFIHPNAH